MEPVTFGDALLNILVQVPYLLVLLGAWLLVFKPIVTRHEQQLDELTNAMRDMQRTLHTMSEHIHENTKEN